MPVQPPGRPASVVGGVFHPRPHPGGPRAVYLRTLCFVFHGRRLLLIRQRSHGSVWWNALGGKIERSEDPLEAAQREVWEEAGLRPALQFRGVATAIVASAGAHWTIFLFSGRVDRDHVAPSPEGALRWAQPGDLRTLRVFPDLPLLLPPLRRPRGVVLAKFIYATGDPRSFDRAAARVTVFDRVAAP